MISKSFTGAAMLLSLVTMSMAGLVTHRSAPLVDKLVRQGDAHLELQVLAQIKYECTVPASVPAHIDWHHDGQPILVNGPDIYRRDYRGGWGEYLFFFLSDQVMVLTDHSNTITFVAGPHLENPSPWNDGYTQCRSQLRTLVKPSGAQRVRAAILNHLEEIQKDLWPCES